MDYMEAWTLQKRFVDARVDGRLGRDIVFILEHQPVFTLGRRGGLGNLKVTETFIKSRGMQIIHVERGGDITFHGPGQLIIYPIIHLRSARFKIVEFVEALEEVVIRTIADWGLKGGRNPLNRGVWVGKNKIASIGIAVKRSVSFHGIALNVNTSLEPFGWVNPCGMKNVDITSMKRLLGREITMKEIRERTEFHLQKVLGLKLNQVSLEKIIPLLGFTNEQPAEEVSWENRPG
jgi:lipoate-protein ligase B